MNMYHFRILNRFPDRRLCIDFNGLQYRRPIAPSMTAQDARTMLDWRLPGTGFVRAPGVNQTLALALTALELGGQQKA